MKVLITGGSGFIGQHLCRRLAAHGHELTVLTRKPRKAARVLPEGTRLVTSLDDINSDAAIDGIVNLAGESLFAGRWTERRKKVLFASRVGVTEAVVSLVSRLDRKPAV
ncbi:MAG: NAD-dependent epimerase/dehydratase family protein, partial [Alcanivorax sp.]